MPHSLSELEPRREVIAQEIGQLGDLRPGSITPTSGRCGKPECRGHQAGERVTAPISGSPLKSRAKRSPSLCPPRRPSAKPRKRGRSSANSRGSFRSL